MMENLLTRAECEKILIAHSERDLVLKDFKVEKALDAHGFLGEYFYLFLNCGVLKTSQEIQLKFFIKSLPHESDEAEKVNIFEKESKLYATLLKQLQQCTTTVWCPQALYTRKNLIVLEELHTAGYEKLRKQNQNQNLSIDELKSVLSALAAMHAASIVHETKSGITLTEQYPKELFREITISPKIAWYTTGLKAVMALAKNHPKYQSQSLQHFIAHDLAKHLARVYEMQRPSLKYRNVLCHRDPWHANVLFHQARQHAILVDYQTAIYCPPIIDFIFALFLNLSDSELRQRKESTLLTFYFDKFKSELSTQQLNIDDHLTYGELLQSFDEFKLFGFVYRAIAFTLINVPADLITNDYKYVNRANQLLDLMSINKKFRTEIEACIAELLDYILHGEFSNATPYCLLVDN